MKNNAHPHPHHHHRQSAPHQSLQPDRQNIPPEEEDAECSSSSPLVGPSTPSNAPLFLNVTQHMMVRQSSDTTQNRLGVCRKLSRSPAFDNEPTTSSSDDGAERDRPATSCLAQMEMHFCSPQLLKRPTQLTQQVVQTNVVDSQDGSDYIQLNQYRLMEEIAQGSYGIVKLAYNEQDKNLYALKVLDKLKLVKNFACFRPPPIRKKSQNVVAGGAGGRGIQQPEQQLAVHRNPLQLVQREIAILKKLSHPNVVKLVEVLDDPHDNFLYMVFEYVERRSLMELPTDHPLSEHIAWKHFRDTLKGLEYLHYQKIVHRDLKPSNLLLSEAELVKIADFGVSCEFEGIDAFLTGTAGTPAFMAPEALSENSSQFYSGRAQDIWSLGITLFALVSGNVPWYDAYVIALYKRIKTEAVEFPENVLISDLLKGLILGMLRKDPGLRYDILQIKEHPWVTRNAKVPMPTEEENCSLVTVTQEEVNQAVRVIPHLGTLILVKAMGRKKHFGNPFRENEQQLGGQSLRNRRKSSSLRDPLYPAPASAVPSSPVRSTSRERLLVAPSLNSPSAANREIVPADRMLQKLRLEEEEGGANADGSTKMANGCSVDREAQK